MALADSDGLPLESERAERVRWFVTLRWVVGLAMLGSGAVASAIAPRFYRPLLDLGLLVISYNVVFAATLRRLNPRVGVHLQIMFDWVVLTLLCIATGNLHSPFVFFFVLHVAQTSVFLGRTACFFQGVFAVLLAAGMTFFVPFSLGGSPFRLEVRPGFRWDLETALFWTGFATVVLLVTFVSTSVMGSLRRKQQVRLQLEESLRNANRELVELDAARTRFIRMTAHEIRGPLAATQSLLHVLLDGYVGELNPKAEELLGRAERRMEELIGLVNELLDLVQGAQRVSEADREDIDMTAALESLVAELSAHAAKKGIRLSVELPMPHILFWGDRQDVDRIFHNLLSNALNYTPEGGRIHLEAQLADFTPTAGAADRVGAGKALRVRVEDTGIGIPAADLPKIFDEFHRGANAKAQKKTGTGLGLAIVKKTVEKYGGRVEVASEVERGAQFTVFLPLDRTLAPAGGDS